MKYPAALIALAVFCLLSSSAAHAGAADTAGPSRVIAITSPEAGIVIAGHEVVVTGRVSRTSGAEVGVTVNGFIALHHDGRFAVFVPVDFRAPPWELSAIVRDPSGATLGEHTIPVSFKPPAWMDDLSFRATPVLGVAPHTMSFSLLHRREAIAQIELDLDGDGVVDFRGGALDKQTFQLREPGLYMPAVKVRAASGGVQTAKALVRVFDRKQLDALLQAKWKAMKSALRAGNLSLALDSMTADKRSEYREIFEGLRLPLAKIDDVLADPAFVELRGTSVEYAMPYLRDGKQYSGLVIFTLDADGMWRIRSF